jgi:flagellin
MSFGVLNNIPALQAEAALGNTQSTLNSTLEQLATGQRINSGATDPAGLAIANGLSANIAALNQSIQNANDGTGSLQVADGALSQVTSLLNTAVTIATEAATGTVSSAQRDSMDTVGALSTTVLGLTTGGTNTSLAGTDGTGAQAALTAIDAAIQTVANDRGTIGASVNRLNDASAVMTTQVQNLTAAENNIMAADIPSTISDLSRESVLNQTGMAALAQANSQESSILTLLH